MLVLILALILLTMLGFGELVFWLVAGIVVLAGAYALLYRTGLLIADLLNEFDDWRGRHNG